ncbi:MAG: metallophosphoesterase family protein [Desulfomonilaceae bacterium]
MKIGVLSDTHLRAPNPVLEYILQGLLADTEIILHAGDIVSRKVLDCLEMSGVIAVCGNMDDHEVAQAIPQVRTIPAAGKRIALIHGWGSRDRLEQRILGRFQQDRPDLIVYGHSHVPFWGEVDGVPMFNPGSARQSRHAESGTVGLIEIIDGNISGKILSVDQDKGSH